MTTTMLRVPRQLAHDSRREGSAARVRHTDGFYFGPSPQRTTGAAVFQLTKYMEPSWSLLGSYSSRPLGGTPEERVSCNNRNFNIRVAFVTWTKVVVAPKGNRLWMQRVFIAFTCPSLVIASLCVGRREETMQGERKGGNMLNEMRRSFL